MTLGYMIRLQTTSLLFRNQQKMKLSENEFFLLAVSLIEKKQKLLKQTMDKHCIELINEVDQLLSKLEKNNPKVEGIIGLIYEAQGDI
tara:strand:+ start:1793 stop:2056 length:264 start_codon:yes stop_codon:yes gene_type:complete